MKIALFGNPNTGKSSVFNMLTGMRQHVGNFAGITVEKKSGYFQSGTSKHEIIDFPGVYSLYPDTKDEEVVHNVLNNSSHADFPELALVVVDASNLERNLVLFSQIADLGIPCILVLNMWDLTKKRKISIDVEKLETELGINIVTTTARVGIGKERLLDAISKVDLSQKPKVLLSDFQLCSLDETDKQEKEILLRRERITEFVQRIQTIDTTEKQTLGLDKWLVHPVWGYFVFVGILAVVFQFIYNFAAVPMDWLDLRFSELSSWLQNTLPAGAFTDLIAEGIVPGIGGVVVFVPQIALLFFFIAILEESGYLARVVFIMDRLMRPFGLNGKSVVPLMSSVACAIPGVMATRTISDWKERLITILVAPLMSCSARIPVYTLLIALVVPKKMVGGIFELQGLVLLALYLLGIVAALVVSIILKQFIRTEKKGFMLLEMPSYRVPIWKNVGLMVYEKARVFVIDAGKIILAISIILWALAKYGPEESRKVGQEQLAKSTAFKSANDEDKEAMKSAVDLETSYIGILGKGIEPVIRPLGYDWKIGIALITSFAAREVFVGSLSTIYSVQSDEVKPLIKRMKDERNTRGELVFTTASGVSMMVFYVFAMQCMATLAVVKRETGSWKWPTVQLIGMGALAYFGAWLAFVLLS